MTCHEFERDLPAYLAGSLSEEEAQALERHAAECATCDARLDQMSRVPVGDSPFTMPVGLREQTLAAVAHRRQRQRTSRWMRTVTAIAAVLVLAVAVREFASRSSARRGTETPVATTNPVAPSTTTPPATTRPDSIRTDTADRRARPPVPSVAVTPAAPKSVNTNTSRESPAPASTVSRILVSNPDRFAEERSSTEFKALDAAARELEAALVRAPDDAQLRGFLATVQARRDELTRRVKAAKS